MARQSTTPLQHPRSVTRQTGGNRTSGRAGVVVPLDYMPVLRGDSVSGTYQAGFVTGPMPKRVQNPVYFNIQAWFMPFSALPQFASVDEFKAAYQGEPIKSLSGDRTAPALFNVAQPATTAWTQITESPLWKHLGLHPVTGKPVNDLLLDAYTLIYNNRLRAHSSKLDLRKYFRESGSTTALARAFWPQNRFTSIVADYEAALVQGAWSLDIAAGEVPLEGKLDVMLKNDATKRAAQRWVKTSDGANNGAGTNAHQWISSSGNSSVGNRGKVQVNQVVSGEGTVTQAALDPKGSFEVDLASIVGTLDGQSLHASTRSLDNARKTEAYARVMAAYAGLDHSGHYNEDLFLAELMQGFAINEQEQYRRPWLVASQIAPVQFGERFSSSPEDLEASTSRGLCSASLRLNLPKQDMGGVIFVTAEMMPARVHERQGDDFLFMTDPEDFPDPIRDQLNPEPVDFVPNWRIDARHTTPDGLYGFEPLNYRVNRDFTRLGGDYYQEDPEAEWTEQRAAIWMPQIIDPNYTEDHFLAPDPFPHTVFKDEQASAFEVQTAYALTVVGQTVIGDALIEDNGEFEYIEGQIDA